MSRPVVYLAAPYTAPTPEGIEANVRRAERFAQLLVQAGLAVVVPHTLGFSGLYGSPTEGDGGESRKAALDCSEALAAACPFIVEMGDRTDGMHVEIEAYRRRRHLGLPLVAWVPLDAGEEVSLEVAKWAIGQHSRCRREQFAAVASEIEGALFDARAKHGLQHELPLLARGSGLPETGRLLEALARKQLAVTPTWMAILAEEMGEALQETDSDEDLRAELLQVAAMCCAVIDKMDHDQTGGKEE